MKTLMKLFLMFAVILGGLNMAHAQNSKKEKQAANTAAIKKMMIVHNYVFKADYAYPLRGGQKILNYDYDLRVSKDSIIAFLPYYGVAHLAPNPGETEGGIKFTSTNFIYEVKQNKNGTWDIFIKPKDNNITDWRDVQQLRLSISPKGYANLQVISSNRDPISFSGYIAEKNKM
ncbi:MAG TPA: DUF4251 domain-containing protein [Mucilaginibacter sp.]|jgi:hypothetical protein